MKNFENCKIDRIEYKDRNEFGYNIIVPANKDKGFNFPYVLFVPDKISSNTSLIVEGANTWQSNNNIEEAIQDVINECMDREIIKWNVKTNYPILTPAFPKLNEDEDGPIYTHMLSKQALNYNKHGLDRIDIQLINMINDAKFRLMANDIIVDDKVILDGFSASAKFVNRFGLLHPEIVKLIIAGAVSGTLILPIKEIDGEKLIYPVGCGDIDEITNEKIDQFKKIKQFYYMGELDNNDPFECNEDGSLKYHQILSQKEANQIYKYIGKKMIPDRWEKIQKIYNELNINAIFKTYKGYGHNPFPAKDKVIELLEECNL